MSVVIVGVMDAHPNEVEAYRNVCPTPVFLYASITFPSFYLSTVYLTFFCLCAPVAYFNIQGKTQLFGFFVGKVMAATQGRADPELANTLLKLNLEP